MQAQAAPKSGADPFAPMGAGAQKAAGNVAQLQRAQAGLEAQQARLARTQGDTAKAAELEAQAQQRLQNTLAQQNTTTTQTIAMQRQLVSVQQQAAKATQQGAGFAQQLGQAYTSSLMSIVGPAAIATASIAAVGKAGELIRLGAQADQTRLRFDGLAAAAHTTGDALLSALRSASAGTISDLNLELAANRAQLLGVADSAQEFSTLMGIARARAQDMGISTTQAFNDLITGLGRGSALILDNLGITVSVTEANKAYADQIGKTASALTEAEQKQALINAVLTQGQDALERTGGAAETTATKIERLSASWENLKATAGAGLSDLFEPAIVGADRLLRGTEGVNEALAVMDAEQVGRIAGWKAYNDAIAAGASQEAARAAQAQAAADAYANYTGWVTNASGATQANTGAALQNATAQSLLGGSIGEAIAMAIQHEAATRADAQATIDAAAETLIDAQAKSEQAAQTELAALQAQAAADAFLQLHPNISASSAASLAAAAGMSPLIQRLIEATIRAQEARAAVIAFNNAANIKAVNAAIDANRAAGRMGRGDSSDYVEQGRAYQRIADAAAEARRQQVMTVGTHQQQLNLLQQEYAQAVKIHGANSAAAIQAETALKREQAQKATGGGRGGGGTGDKAAKAAEATTGRLADIAKSGGDKLAEIDRTSQEKLLAIDEKYAEQRLEAQRALSDEIAQMSADVKFDQTLDNFDAFQKDMTKEQAAAFKEREAAEARYAERITAAQEEARQIAANGDADYAKDVLKIREEQAKRQMEIEQRAAQANADTGGKQAAAVAATAAAATKASEDQANTEIAIAQAKAQEKGKAQADEKQAVLDAAEQQRQDVIKKAEDTASKVKGASDSQKSTVVDNLRAQAQAAKDWADTLVRESGRGQQAMAGVTGPPAAPGGGAGEGEPPAGEAPAPSGGGGGQGIAGRRGASGKAVGGGGGSGDVLETLRAAVAYLSSILPLIKQQNEFLKHVRTYQHTMMDTIKVFGEIINLHKALSQPLPPLPAGVFEQLAGEVNQMMLVLSTKIDPQLAKSKRLFEHILGADQAAVAVFTEITNLRRQLAAPSPPIMLDKVQALANEAMLVVSVLRGQLTTANKAQTELLKNWADQVTGTVSILGSIADLRKNLAEPAPLFDVAYLVKLATEAKNLVAYFQTVLIPVSEEQAAVVTTFSDAVQGTVDSLTAVQELHKSLAEPQPPITVQQVIGLAREAIGIVAYLQTILLPLTEEQADLISRFGDSAGAAIDALNAVNDLHKELAEPVPPITIAQVKLLAAEAQRITAIFLAQLLPTTEEQATAAQAYADRAGAAVDTLKGVVDLRKEATDLAGPIPDRVILALANEAKRVATIVATQLIPTTEDQADATQRWADRVGSVVDVLSGVASLRKDTADLAGPIPERAIVAMADEAKRVTQIVLSRTIPTTDALADAAKRYSETSGATISVLRDVASLRKDAADLAPALSVAQITRLADDAKRIAQIVLSRAVPASEEQAAAAKRYAETTGAAVDTLSSVLGLPAKMFTDYQSPSDAQISRVVADANRIVQRVNQAAKAYSTDGLDAAKAFGDATGSIITAFKDQLLFVQAIGSGDFTLDPKKLGIFETGMRQTIAAAGRLGAQAAAIPQGNIAALQSTTAALTAAYESMIRLSAVPFGNLPALAQGFGAAVGGGGTTIVVNVNNPPASLNVPALIAQVKQGIAQGVAGKH